VALICEPLKAAETALSQSGSESVPPSVSQLLAIHEIDCNPDLDLHKWGLGGADKSVAKRQKQWRSIPVDSRVCQTFSAYQAVSIRVTG
jgi:hypothetical protein